jgi:Fe-S-cluster containining protein
MSERAVFREFLGANYWIGDAMTSYETVWVVAPATSNMLPGNEYPYRPFGRCVFLTDKGRCRVHEVRPYECRQAHHGGDEKHSADTRHKIVKAWAKQQPRVEKLAGRELFEPDGNYFDLMFD